MSTPDPTTPEPSSDSLGHQRSPTPPGEGERRAQRGYTRQYSAAAAAIYHGIDRGDLRWVGLADRCAGIADDVVLGYDGNVVGHQFKTSQASGTFRIRTLLTGANGLLPFDVWHDRAVFHFLTSPEDRYAYVQAVLRGVKPGGHVIVATFAEDGPLQCSGLPVKRYNKDELHAEFGEAFTLTQHGKESHHTPFGTAQQFTYCYCRKQV